MMKVNKLVFINSVNDAMAFLKNDACSSPGVLFISMAPDVYDFLQKRRLLVHSTTGYFTRDSHVNASLKASEITEWMNENLKFIDFSLPINVAFKDLFIFFSRFSVHRCLYEIETVTNAIRMHQPKEVWASVSGKEKTDSLFLESEEKSLGYLVKQAAEKSGIPFRNLTGSDVKNSLTAKKMLGNTKKLIKFILGWELFNRWEMKIKRENCKRGDRPIFFTSPLYNLERLRQDYQRRFSQKRFYILQGPLLAPLKLLKIFSCLDSKGTAFKIIKQKEIFSKLAKNITNNKKIFQFNGLEFSLIISSKILDNIADFVCGFIFWSNRLNIMIDRIKPQLFISNGSRDDDVALSELCRANGIPDLLISHGSHVFPKNKSEQIEWGEHGKKLVRAPFSHLALQTPAVEGYFQAFPTSASLIKTGPLIWGMKVDRVKAPSLFHSMFNGKYNYKEKKIIVHAGTPKPIRSPRLFVYETPDEYISALKDLSAAVERIPDAVLIIKFRPSPEISVDTLKALVPFSEKVVLSIEQPFLDVLGMADLLVSFSSTAIEEALQNRVPVLLYGGEGRYQHLSGYQLKNGSMIPKSAVYHISDAETLEQGIKNILNLNLVGNGEDAVLFNQYVYGEEVREPLEKVFIS